MSNLIDTTSLFSAPEPAYSHATTEAPPPMRNPFQAPDFDETASGASTTPDADADTREQSREPSDPEA